jgi:hypothetical protein
VTFAFVVTCYTQPKSDIIKGIKVEFNKINADKGLRKVILENEEFLENMTDGGGELSGYFMKGQIKKVRQWVGLSNGNETKEFYFKNGQLIFVYEKFDSFIFNPNKEQLDHTKTETTFEGRYYFNNNKIIDYRTTGHNRFEDDTIDPEKTLLEEASKNVKQLTKNK